LCVIFHVCYFSRCNTKALFRKTGQVWENLFTCSSYTLFDERDMPKYSQSDIKFIIGTDEFKDMYNNADGRENRAWLTILWFTGARPSEILELRKKDITINPESIVFVLSTKKLGFRKSDGFIIEKRTLVLKISEKKRYVRNLKNYLKPFKDTDFIFSFSRRHGLNILLVKQNLE